MDNNRYERHALIDWLSQDALRAMRVAVAGTGAIGNEVVKNLALLGVGNIDIYDFDTIEIHNLTRSVLFREGDVGSRKVECAAARARELDPNIAIRAIHGDVWRTLSLRDVAGYDVVISCVDSLETRMRLSRLCRIVGTDFINTGISSRVATVGVFPFRQAPGCACFECALPRNAYKNVAKRYSCGWLPRRAFVENKIPTTIVTASVSGAMAASAAFRMGDQAGEHQMFMDTITGHLTTGCTERRSACAGCGWLEDVIEIIVPPSATTEALADACEGYPQDTILQLSDALIVRGQCANCTYELGADACWSRAQDHDDGLMTCPECREASVAIEIRDRFSVAEFTAMPSRRLPVKFAIAALDDKSLVFDLEAVPSNSVTAHDTLYQGAKP